MSKSTHFSQHLSDACGKLLDKLAERLQNDSFEVYNTDSDGDPFKIANSMLSKDKIKPNYVEDIFIEINSTINVLILETNSIYTFNHPVKDLPPAPQATYNTNYWQKIFSAYANNRKMYLLDSVKTLKNIKFEKNVSIVFVVLILVGLLALVKFHSLYWLLLFIPGVIIGIFGLDKIVTEYNEDYTRSCSNTRDGIKKISSEFLMSFFNQICKPSIDAILPDIYRLEKIIGSEFYEQLWDFYYDSQQVIQSLRSEPNKISTNESNVFFDYNFENEICRLADRIDIPEEVINSSLNEYISNRKPLLEKNIVENTKTELHNLISEYLNVVSSHGKRISTLGGVSIKNIEESISKSLKIDSSSLDLKGNIDEITNLVIGAGAIGAGILSGGAGMALIASGPVGWITGALLGGMFLLGGKGVIKGVLRMFGVGLSSDKMNKHLQSIKNNVRTKTMDSLDPTFTKIADLLEETTDDIIKIIINESQQTHDPLLLEEKEC